MLTVKLKSPFAVAVPTTPFRVRSYVPAAAEFAACRCTVVPVGGSGRLAFVVVIPVGRLPNITVPLPLTFTSEGCTTNEKLLAVKTVVGDGLAHKASNGGFVAGYANGSEATGIGGSGLKTVNDRAPVLLTKPSGK